MADFGGGVCANRILLAYEQDLPALDDRSAAVVAAERAGLCRRGPSGSLCNEWTTTPPPSKSTRAISSEDHTPSKCAHLRNK